MALISASVYYNDEVTYTGDAGSETNPYCIETIQDFADVNKIANCFCMLPKDFDFNETDYKFGVTSSTYFCGNSTVTLLGNHKTMRNLTVRCNSQVLFTFKEVRDLNFCNFTSLQSTTVPFNTCMVRCSISGYYYKPPSVISLINQGTFEQCSINIGGIFTAGFNFCTCIDVHIHFEDVSLTSSTQTGLIDVTTFNNSWMDGKINFNGASGYMSVSYLFITNSAVWSNSYIAVNIVRTGRTGTFYIVNKTPQSTCFVDTSLISDSASAYVTTNFLAVTTDQVTGKAGLEYLPTQGYFVAQGKKDGES